MRFFKWLNLQLFADGAGAAGDGGDGAATGVTADAAGQQMLRDLGVPEDRIAKRAKAFTKRMQKSGTLLQNAPNGEPQVAAAKDNAPKEDPKQDGKRLTWEELMADPEYNGEMQKVVQARLKKERAAQERLDKLAPAIEALCGKHGLDPNNPDIDALVKAVTDDESLYDNLALELGTSKATAKRFAQQEAENKRLKAAEDLRAQEAANEARNRMEAEHYRELVRQGEELKKIFPSFDLDTELKNSAFLRMTSPGLGISVEQAYHALHHKEISAAAAKVTAQMTAEKMANAIRSNGARPQENGTSAAAPSTATFDPRKMTRAEREDIRRRVRAGEKVTFG